MVDYVCMLQHAPKPVSNALWPMDGSPPDSSVHMISVARIMEWVAISFSGGSSGPRDRTHVYCIAGGFFTSWATAGEDQNIEDHHYLKEPLTLFE